MPKRPINSFNAGELSPYLYARDDLDKYNSGCLTMENFVPLPYGGATRRPALKYIGASNAGDKIRLIPFKASVVNSFVLELGAGYLRIWDNTGALVVDGNSEAIELVTTYTEDDLPDIRVAQSIDIMWLAHPSYPLKKLSRVSETSWSFGDEEFTYPPLLDINQTDIKIWGSATTGDITLSSSIDFFDAGHVGAYFALDYPRDKDSASITTSLASSGYSDELYVGSSNWELTTRNAWNGRVVLQRSLDGGETWEDYVEVGSTIGVGASARSNYTLSSDGPETPNTRLRIFFKHESGTFASELKTSDQWRSLVKITDYTDAQNVSATVINELESVPSDYTAWATSTAYAEGDKILVEPSLDYDGVSTDLEAINSELTDLKDCTYGGGYFWAVTDVGSGAAKKIWKLDRDLTAIESGFPVTITSEFDKFVEGITFYNDELYLFGNHTSNKVMKVKTFDLTGVFVEEKLSFEPSIASSFPLGITFLGDGFYLSYNSDISPTSYIVKYSKAFAATGVITSAPGDFKYAALVGVGDNLYTANDLNNRVDQYNTSLVEIDTFDISSETTVPIGIANDGSTMYVFGNNGSGVMTAFEYTLVNKNRYYECVVAHTSASAFSTDYTAGKWAIREPEVTDWYEGAFSDYKGNASSLALFENRLVLSRDDMVWLSVIDDYPNFLTGDLDDDGLYLTLNSGSLDGVKWLVPQNELVIGTDEGEWTLGASDERKPISPTAYNLKRKTNYGSKGLQAILVNSAVLFTMRQGRKVREWSQQNTLDRGTAPDLTILSEHITKGGIDNWAFQQQPDNIIWCIRSDGELLGFTYERDQGVTGWHRHGNDRFVFESIAVIPKINEEDEVWVSVKATINSVTKRYIARMNDRDWGTNYLTEWQGSDLYKTYTSPATATLTGLDYLEGESVVVVGDGVVESTEKTVTSGSITVDSASYTTVTVGLPFTSTLAPIYLDVQGQFSTTKGSKKAVRRGVLKLKDTFSAKVSADTSGNREDVVFDQDDSPLYNGDYEVWFDTDGSKFLQTCYIQQSDPMPCTVLAVIPIMEGSNS